MSYQARFVSGCPEMVDHTPGADVAAGDVIVTANTTRIAHRDIASGELGALAADGGVYEVAGDAAMAEDKKVYWNATTHQITETATGNVPFGYTVTACTGAAALCKARHDPAA